jgi:hypothetical protein
MHPDLEEDFLNQKTLLLRLIAERLSLADGAAAAAELDEQIVKVKSSYVPIKRSNGTREKAEG